MYLSVVVLTRDNFEEFRSTIASINSQDLDSCGDYEFSLQVIVVDGSKSGLASSLLDIEPVRGIDLVLCRDYPPVGIFPAMNLALSGSTGDYVLFLNSGDNFYDSTSLKRLVCCMSEFRKGFGYLPLAVFGQASIEPVLSRSGRAWLVPDPAVVSIRNWLLFYYPNHQSLLVEGEWVRSHPFRLDAPQSADRTWMRLLLSNLDAIAYLPEPVVRFALGGVSSGLPNFAVLCLRLREPSRTLFEKSFEIFKFFLFPLQNQYPRIMAFRSWLIGRIV